MNKFYYVLIAGSRGFKDYNFMCQQMDILLKDVRAAGYKIVIISGMANGADTLGVDYGNNFCYDVIRCPANWNKYNKAAGYIRNEIMGDLCSACVIFWDGKSPGSKNMYEICKRMNKEVKLFIHQ